MHYHILNLRTKNSNFCVCTCLWFQFSNYFLLTCGILPAALPAFFCSEEIWLCCSGYSWALFRKATIFLRLHSNYNMISLIQLSPCVNNSIPCNILCASFLGGWYLKRQSTLFPTQTLRSLWHSGRGFAQVPSPKYLLSSPCPIWHSYF